MATLVLVHGAWHGAWCWEPVVPLLEASGHKVAASDLPGMGDDPTPLGGVTPELWAEAVADRVRAAVGPVVLVGHSRGGAVISRAAELVPDRVAMPVHLAASLVPDGATLLDALRRIPPRPEAEGSLVFSPDGTTSTIAPGAVGRVFYNTTPEPLVARAALLSCPEPMASFTSPLRISSDRYGSVPRVCIECARDRAIAPELQRMMVADLPCRRVIGMDTDHSPFYSAPQKLAAHLVRIADEVWGIGLPTGHRE